MYMYGCLMIHVFDIDLHVGKMFEGISYMYVYFICGCTCDVQCSPQSSKAGQDIQPFFNSPK